MNKQYNPHLDGLRGIAILLVVCFHYLTNLYIGDYGWSGVDLFFVISGYLLTGRLYPYLRDKKLLWKFYLNRFLRIVPLYYLFLAVFFTMWFCFTSVETQNTLPVYKTHWWGFWGFMTNWIMIYKVPDIVMPLSHLWSLSVEEQFYICFPLLVILVKNRKILLLIGTCALICIPLLRCIYYFLYRPEQPLVIYWNTFFRADSFSAGFVLYLLTTAGRSELLKKFFKPAVLISAAGLITGIILYGARLNVFFVTIGFSFNVILYAYFVFLAESPGNNLLKKITAFSFLRKTGKISYGLYIFHWPVFFFFVMFFDKMLLKAGVHLPWIAAQLISAAISLSISYVISLLSFRYYESYFLKLKKKPAAE